MELSNKAAYLQGLVDGLGVDESTKEGKIIKAMSALLAEMAEALEGMDEDLSRAYDQINDLSDELEDLEADLYEDEDDDEDEGDEDEDDEDEDDEDDEEDADDANDDDIASEPFYEVACPNCGETVYVKKLFVSRPDRALVRARAAQAALELVLRLAQGRTPAGTKPLTAAQQHDTAVLDALDAVFLSE